MSSYKMKSLLKGLRYISQIFENEKEPEMQIGTPTDVKHVAHIGWDGGSVNQNSPSWMNDFKTSGGYSSAPFGNIKEDASCISEDSTRSRDRPGLPKSTRDRSNNNTIGSPTKERSRRGSSNSSVNNNKTSRRSSKESNSDIRQDGSTKSRGKKSKDSVNGGSSRRTRRESQSESINGSMSDASSMISISNDT